MQTLQNIRHLAIHHGPLVIQYNDMWHKADPESEIPCEKSVRPWQAYCRCANGFLPVIKGATSIEGAIQKLHDAFLAGERPISFEEDYRKA